MVARENDKALYTMLNCSGDISWTVISIAWEGGEKHNVVFNAEPAYVRREQACEGRGASM